MTIFLLSNMLCCNTVLLTEYILKLKIWVITWSLQLSLRDKVSLSYLFSQNAVCVQRGENISSSNTLGKMQQKFWHTWMTKYYTYCTIQKYTSSVYGINLSVCERGLLSYYCKNTKPRDLAEHVPELPWETDIGKLHFLHTSNNIRLISLTGMGDILHFSDNILHRRSLTYLCFCFRLGCAFIQVYRCTPVVSSPSVQH